MGSANGFEETIRGLRGLLCGGVLALAAIALPQGALAQANYSYTGASYSTLTNFTSCEAGDCRNFSSGMSASGSFQTASALAPGLSSANVASLVTAFSFTDGLTTYSSGDPQAYINELTVSTDGTGAITAAVAVIIRSQTATPAATSAPPPLTNPDTKIDVLAVRAVGTVKARHNATCYTMGVAPSGRPNSCLNFHVTDTGRAEGESTAAQWVSSVSPVAAVPTMSEWAMILLGLMLAGFAALTMRSRPV